jgi:hypothetical protein
VPPRGPPAKLNVHWRGGYYAPCNRVALFRLRCATLRLHFFGDMGSRSVSGAHKRIPRRLLARCRRGSFDGCGEGDQKFERPDFRI